MTDLIDDGCTGWVDGWGGVQWRPCCDAHDWVFHTGTTWWDFIRANLELWWCVAQTDMFAATIMLFGVSSPVAMWLFFRGRKKNGIKR